MLDPTGIFTFSAGVGFSSEPETKILLGDTGLETGIPSMGLGIPYFDASMPLNITAQVSVKGRMLRD